MRVTAKKILSLNPCNSRKDNFLSHHSTKASFSFEAFMDLKTITSSDKVWVACRILPRHLIEIFAIDCAIRAETYAAAAANAAYAAAYAAYAAAAYAAYAAAYAYAAYAADAAADAATAAAAADADAANADAAAERQTQIESLIWLVQNAKL